MRIESNYPGIVQKACRSTVEKQGRDTVVLDMRELVSYTDYFLITTGESALQVRAIADEIIKKLKEAGIFLHHIEGYEEAGWVLLDFGDLVVHVFMPEVRGFYDLEKLWADAPTERIEDNG